ncbi:hypothetical protein [Streptomyces murinus]|uniref:hypothetical protein n=1 Tax=Streptomyces murinus TaxID=33900 RepID=UPI003F48A3CD
MSAQLGQGVTAGRRPAAVNTVLPRLFADGPTPDELRDALPSLPSLAVLAVAAVATAMPSASSTATSRSRRPSGQNCNGSSEAGKFGTGSARSMLRLSAGVGNVVIGPPHTTVRSCPASTRA